MMIDVVGTCYIGLYRLVGLTLRLLKPQSPKTHRATKPPSYDLAWIVLLGTVTVLAFSWLCWYGVMQEFSKSRFLQLSLDPVCWYAYMQEF